MIYNSLKERDRSRARHDDSTSTDISVYNYTLYATIAGVTTITVTNPLFLIKTRMCLQYSVPAHVATGNEPVAVKYTSSWHALRSLVQRDGLRGLYKGIVPGYLGTLNGTIQMVTYDLMKSAWLRQLKSRGAAPGRPDQSLDSFHYTLFSGLSKILAVTCTYPFQLVRARLQDQHREYKNLYDLVAKTLKNEGVYGFYKGLIPCLLRVTPAASVTFIVYENLLIFFNRRSSASASPSPTSGSDEQS